MQVLPKKIKAVFFDIDGTLISFKTHSMPDSTRKALQALRDKGIRLFVATGRSPNMMPFMDQFFKFDGYVVLNGQYCYNSQGIVRKHTIEVDDIRLLKALIRKHNFPCLFIHAKGGTLNMIDDRVRELYRVINHPLPEPADLDDVPENEVLQFVSFMPEGGEKIITDHLKTIDMTRFLPICFDAIPKGGGKDAGIRAMLESENILPEEVMAFGDGHNDIGMLNYVGIGVAMGDAEQIVKDNATYVTSSVDDDGILRALRHFNVL